jgi:hypothetical protein
MLKDPILITQDVDGADIWLPGLMIPVDGDVDGTDIWTPQPG